MTSGSAMPPSYLVVVATAGQKLVNPVTGERFEFRVTAADSGGELLELDDIWVRPDHTVAAHVHPEMEETFEVLSGRASIRVDGEVVEAGPGDTVVAPAGTPHSGRNASGGEVHLRLSFRPALRWEEVVESLVRLAEEGRTDDRGTPEPSAMAKLLREYAAELAPPSS
jgi:mannose-6-phosphate isomerase-like protein (cupin superfamily)